jgi:hypothetical protein
MLLILGCAFSGFHASMGPTSHNVDYAICAYCGQQWTQGFNGSNVA